MKSVESAAGVPRGSPGTHRSVAAQTARRRFDRGCYVLVVPLPFRGEERQAVVREDAEDVLRLDLRDQRGRAPLGVGTELAVSGTGPHEDMFRRVRVTSVRGSGDQYQLACAQTSTAGAEARRRERRVQLSSTEFTALRLDRASTPTFRAVLVDLSPGGAAIRTAEPLEVGIPVRMGIVVPGGAGLRKLLGTVVSVFPLPGGVRAGIRFEKIDQDQRRALRTFVTALEAAAR